ncbi:MAG: hypothetical protein SGI92_25010, partial [Bryobacteraceae bacterium]|nr:hypothetical protein [Bryobacteraceae bacterium]
RTIDQAKATNPVVRPPTKDHFVFPWETEMTDIEWAVATVLKTKYPDIHQEIMWAACAHGDLIPDSDPRAPGNGTATKEPQDQ